MHQQPRATEQPVPLKTASRSDQRSGERGATLSFMGFLQFDGAQQCGEPNHEFWPGFKFVSAWNMALRNHRNWAKGRCNRNCVTFAPVRFPSRHRPTPVMNEHFDVIIIGTGAGGGTLAYRLAASGKPILLIERGPYVPREKDNWSTKAVNQDGKYNTKEVWRDRDGKDLHPHTNYYMGHVNSVLMAISKCPNPTVFQKTLSLNDFYFGSREWGFPMGHISFGGKLDGDTLKAGAPALAPHWTLELMGKHSLDFWLTSEDLPDPNNRVTLDRDGKIVLSYKPNNEEGHRRLTEKLKSLMKQQTKCAVHGHECHEGLFARNLYAGQRIPLAGVAHQNGTIRFGADPRTSALDMNCRAHEVDNLYVVDASFFVSSGAVNPALTIMANALRVGDHLLDRWRCKAETQRGLKQNATLPARPEAVLA